MSKTESHIGFGSERAFLLEISALLFALFVSGRTLPLFGTPWLLLVTR